MTHQHTKKLVCDSRGLVDDVIGLVDSILSLTDGKWNFFQEKLREKLLKFL